MIFGALGGNLSDRLFRGHRAERIVDFIHFGFWPTFNVADTAIVIGTLALFIVIVRGSNDSRFVSTMRGEPCLSGGLE